MSELKAISGNEIREDVDYNTRGIDPEDKEWRNYGKELCDTLYYRKSEADKVIAHNKFKRCLDKASLCESEEKRLEAIAPLFDTDKECWEYGSDYWKKWHKRWLQLTEQVKTQAEAK